MRILKMALCVLVLPAAVWAGAPINGVYKSVTLGGPVFEAVGSTSWTNPGGWLQVGNVTTMESFDGNVHATQWYLSCPQQTLAPVLIFDQVDGNGNGNRTYALTYSGGTLWLSGTGPWGNGDASYQAMVDSYTETIVLSYLAGDVVGCNVTFSSVQGHFMNYQAECFSFVIGNKVCVGDTDHGNKPGLYPDFMDANCNPTRTMGSWEDVEDLTLTITGCTVGNEESTWGGVKALYDE